MGPVGPVEVGLSLGKKNLFSKWAGSGLQVLACGSGSGMKKPGPNSTHCHS